MHNLKRDIMATIVKVKNSATPSVTPTTLVPGELALNRADGKLFYLDNADQIKSIGAYTHPIGDGNSHVPATGTISNGKVLMSGSTANSAAWQTITKATVGLSNVDNTADANKPVSGPQQIIFDTKIDKVAGWGLTQNNYTTPEKQKLAGLISSHFRGTFSSKAALTAGIPTGVAGDYADTGNASGTSMVRYFWDTVNSVWTTPESSGGAGLQWWREETGMGEPFTQVNGSPVTYTHAYATFTPNIANIQAEVWGGVADNANVDIRLLPAGDGCISTNLNFTSDYRSVNVSLKEMRHNIAESPHSYFINGGLNTISIATPVSYSDKYEMESSWSYDEAVYGAIIIGGTENYLESQQSAMIESVSCRFTSQDNNNDGTFAALNLAAVSSNCDIFANTSVILNSNNVVTPEASSLSIGLTAIGVWDASISGNDIMMLQTSGQIAERNNNYTVIGGTNNQMRDTSAATLINASNVRGAREQKFVVLGGNQTFVTGTDNRATQNISSSIVTVFENGQGHIQKRRLTGQQLPDMEEWAPTIKIPHVWKATLTNADLRPRMSRVKLEAFFGKNGLEADLSQEILQPLVQAYEIEYLVLQGTANTLVVPQTSVRCKDLLMGVDIDSSALPFQVQVTADEFEGHDRVELVFSGIDNVPNYELGPWVCNYTVDMTEVNGYNATAPYLDVS